MNAKTALVIADYFWFKTNQRWNSLKIEPSQKIFWEQSKILERFVIKPLTQVSDGATSSVNPVLFQRIIAKSEFC